MGPSVTQRQHPGEATGNRPTGGAREASPLRPPTDGFITSPPFVHPQCYYGYRGDPWLVPGCMISPGLSMAHQRKRERMGWGQSGEGRERFHKGMVKF